MANETAKLIHLRSKMHQKVSDLVSLFERKCPKNKVFYKRAEKMLVKIKDLDERTDRGKIKKRATFLSCASCLLSLMKGKPALNDTPFNVSIKLYKLEHSLQKGKNKLSPRQDFLLFLAKMLASSMEEQDEIDTVCARFVVKPSTKRTFKKKCKLANEIVVAEEINSFLTAPSKPVSNILAFVENNPLSIHQN